MFHQVFPKCIQTCDMTVINSHRQISINTVSCFEEHLWGDPSLTAMLTVRPNHKKQHQAVNWGWFGRSLTLSTAPLGQPAAPGGWTTARVLLSSNQNPCFTAQVPTLVWILNKVIKSLNLPHIQHLPCPPFRVGISWCRMKHYCTC